MSSDTPVGSFSYELTDDLAVRATEAIFAWQSLQVKESMLRQGAPHPALPILLVAGLLLIGIASVLWLGADGVFVYVLLISAVLVLLYLSFKWALYFYSPFSRRYLRWLALRGVQGLQPRTIRWTLHEDRLETQSAARTRTVPWPSLVRVQVGPEFWFLFMKQGDPLLAPAAALTAELQAMIRRKTLEVGGSVEESSPIT